jgi:hypothetical protein
MPLLLTVVSSTNELELRPGVSRFKSAKKNAGEVVPFSGEVVFEVA